MKVGNHFRVFNAGQGEYLAEVIDLDRNQLSARLKEPIENHADPQLRINLGLGLSRGERMDYAIQKSTELGIGSITPLTTDRSEVKLVGKRLDNKLAHWRKIAVNASEQCGRNSIAEINTISGLFDWCDNNQEGVVFDHRGTANIKDLKVGSAINLLVGAEGGLTDDELQHAIGNGYCVVKIGPRILRTETAPVVALSLLQHLYGDL